MLIELKDPHDKPIVLDPACIYSLGPGSHRDCLLRPGCAEAAPWGTVRFMETHFYGPYYPGPFVYVLTNCHKPAYMVQGTVAEVGRKWRHALAART